MQPAALHRGGGGGEGGRERPGRGGVRARGERRGAGTAVRAVMQAPLFTFHVDLFCSVCQNEWIPGIKKM
jgi:hypothetical protein